MVDMAKSGIYDTDARLLDQSIINLIERVRAAIAEFEAGPALQNTHLPVWQSPVPWRDNVLANLDRARKEVHAAFGSLAASDSMPLTLAAASLAGLAKDLEYDSSWMTQRAADGVQAALKDLVLIADRIYRAGYADLERTGRV
jgi:hypothetical protein